MLEFTFEDDRYFPQLISFDGNTNPIDAVVFGEKISVVIDNPSMQQTPFMVNQIVTNDKNLEKSSILSYNGKFGPNSQFRHLTLTTEFMWWGEQVDEVNAYAELIDEVGGKPQGQSYHTMQYPFSDSVITRHSQVLNSKTIWLEQTESGPLYFKLYDNLNSFRKSFVSQASLINMIDVEEVNVNDLRNLLNDMKEDMRKSASDLQDPKNTDKIVSNAFSFIRGLNIEVDSLQMKVIPTNDPLVFQTIIAGSFGNLPSAARSNDIEFMKSEKTSFAPGLMESYQMYQGTYAKKQLDKLKNDLKGKSNGRALFSVGGYYIGEIKFNRETAKWENIVLGGGFNIGGGYEKTRNMNQMVGPVPVTYSISIGGGIELDYKTSVLYDALPGYAWSEMVRTNAVNDYLTSLRIIAYIELFGGIGFDYTIVAAKIGVFGRITAEYTVSWLNRSYLMETDDHVLTGHKLTLEGVVGVQAVLKFLFFKRTYTFASLRYSHSWVFDNWNNIRDYWDKHGVSPLTVENMDVAIASYMAYIGEDEMHVLETNTVEDRNYLLKGGRSWHTAESPLGFGLMSLDPVNQAPTALQTNAYPHANPQLADDGSLFVYLSDGNSMNIEDTVASWAIDNGSGYVDQGEINDNHMLQGFGDSNLQIAGEGHNIAAVWITQKDMIEKEAGEEIDNTDILLMNNSTEY